MTDTSRLLQLNEDCSLQDVQQLLSFLEERGTFRFPTLANGLFSAAAAEGADFEQTGYHNVWVRDNIHIAHAHWVWGEPGKAVAALRALMAFFLKYKHRFTDILDGRADASNPMNRPHIRFDGDHLRENEEKWSHAQNDALGAFLWLACKLKEECEWNTEELDLLDKTAQLLIKLPFWQDEDSGHWEEVRKIAASSIGIAITALEQFDVGSNSRAVKAARDALNQILPAECIQTDPLLYRRYDSALLFLIYPYRTVSGEMADQIVADVKKHLMGEHGIRRYLGDSYWCADYKEKLAANERTADFSDNLSARDSLLEPGKEAQWCLFDPIISIHYGLRYERSGDRTDRKLQLFHLNRSLNQLTKSESRFGAYRCPESYFCERGRYVPNDICPLLWTQANLKLALTHLQRGLSVG